MDLSNPWESKTKTKSVYQVSLKPVKLFLRFFIMSVSEWNFSLMCKKRCKFTKLRIKSLCVVVRDCRKSSFKVLHSIAVISVKGARDEVTTSMLRSGSGWGNPSIYGKPPQSESSFTWCERVVLEKILSLKYFYV